MSDHDAPSGLLPNDPFDQLLARLTGLPNGAHTEAKAINAVDFYGTTTAYIVQTVRTDEGETVFLTQVNASGSARFIIPTEVVSVIDRQRQSCLKQVQRRHGKRLVEEGVLRPGGGFTKEARAKALKTRKERAAKRAARRAKRNKK